MEKLLGLICCLVLLITLGCVIWSCYSSFNRLSLNTVSPCETVIARLLSSTKISCVNSPVPRKLKYLRGINEPQGCATQLEALNIQKPVGP